MSAEAPASHPLADLYVARALDPVIELARAVARDFVSRPQHHTEASAEETALLTNFRLLVGSHPEWPDAAQRSFASVRIFADLCQSFGAMRLSAIQYIEAASDSGTPIARRSVAELWSCCVPTVQPLEGAALSAVADAHSAMLKRAVSVVGSGRLAKAFGMAEVTEGWPEKVYSPRFGYLCESISQTLALGHPLRQPVMSRLQRAAQHGAATIVGVCSSSLDDADDDRFADVVHSAAAWATALGEILSQLDVRPHLAGPRLPVALVPVGERHDAASSIGRGRCRGCGQNRCGPLRARRGFDLHSGWRGLLLHRRHGVPSTGDCTNGDCGLSDDCPT